MKAERWRVEELTNKAGMLLKNRARVLGACFITIAKPSPEPGHEAEIVVGRGEKNAKNGKSNPIGCVGSMT